VRRMPGVRADAQSAFDVRAHPIAVGDDVTRTEQGLLLVHDKSFEG
jgi:hypothetical protein